MTGCRIRGCCRYADITGNQIIIHNIRNCDYRTETDYDVHYYDKTFNLDQLRAVDLYLVTWGSPDIAHTMVSFDFTTGDHVCFSIETRKEKGEDYSAVKGFFRQFELTYVIADERDVVRLRTNYRRARKSACIACKRRRNKGGNFSSTTFAASTNCTSARNGITRSPTIAPRPSAPSAPPPTVRRGTGGCC